MTPEEIQQAREIARETTNPGKWFTPGHASIALMARAVLALTEQRQWKRGDRVTWTTPYGAHCGTVVEDQIGTHARVKPDNTREVGALLATDLTGQQPEPALTHPPFVICEFKWDAEKGAAFCTLCGHRDRDHAASQESTHCTACGASCNTEQRRRRAEAGRSERRRQSSRGRHSPPRQGQRPGPNERGTVVSELSEAMVTAGAKEIAAHWQVKTPSVSHVLEARAAIAAALRVMALDDLFELRYEQIADLADAVEHPAEDGTT